MGHAVLAEIESAGQSTVAEGVVVAERPKEVTERAEVEILSQSGISIRPAASRPKKRGMEAQQPGSPSILMPTSRVVEPNPIIRVLSGKAPLLRPLWFRCHLRRLKSTTTIWETKLTSAMNPLFLTPASFRIFQRKRCRCMFLQWFRHRERSPLLRIFLLSLLIISSLS